MPDNRLFLLDGHALVYRAHFAFINRPLINSKGVNTSAMHGFTRTLWDLMKNQQPTHIAVAFDPSGNTFRHDMLESYKANREEQPDDIRAALPWVTQIVQAFHIPIITVENYEADDVIGTLAKQAAREGFDVYMVTPDKDFGQLVEENIKMYKPSRMGNGIEILGVDEILAKWDIGHPDQVIDMLGLMGDSIDNIPGVPGIGPKTAATLLKKYGSMEKLLDSTAELKGKQKERLEEHRDMALLSKKLARIDIEVPVQFSAEHYLIEPFDREWLSEIFSELEIRALAREILGQPDERQVAGGQGDLFAATTVGKSTNKSSAGPAAHSVADKNFTTTEQDYRLVDTPEERKELITALSRRSAFTFDTETTDLDPNLAELVGLSFAYVPGVAFYVPVPAERAAAQAIVDEFKPLLENETITKIGQNLKYDALMLKWYGVDVRGPLKDTMIMHYLLEPDQRHNLNVLAENYLKYQPIPITDLIGKGKKQVTMREVPVQKASDYACEDADITLQLYQALEPEIEEENLVELYTSMEAPLVPVLRDMEYEGINLDVDFLNEYSKVITAKMEAMQEEIYVAAGETFNLGSPKQVGEALFDRMKIPYKGSKTKSGQYRTDEATLTELGAEYPLVAQILQVRSMSKLLGTYIDALPKLVNPKTGRIHSSFNQTIAATGRLSSNNPNLQNIPIRTPEGAEVRKAFIPRDKDHVLLASDYSQIELRLVAALSEDKNMVDAFQQERDIHRATAALVFDTPYDDVSREQRNQAKTVNFAILYGAGAQRLMQELNITRSEAGDLIKNYFDRFPGLRAFMDGNVATAREQGYVTTLLGRRRFLRDITSKSGLARTNAERMAMNTPIQGTAADMIKIAMINIHQALIDGNFRTRMILQVHDELVFDAPRDEVAAVTPLIEKLMREAIPDLAVPIVVETGTGENWLEAH